MEGREMNSMRKLVGFAVVAVAVAIASFHGDIALALGVTALVLAAFVGVAILVGAAVSTRPHHDILESGRSPALADAAPQISPLQKQ